MSKKIEHSADEMTSFDMRIALPNDTASLKQEEVSLREKLSAAFSDGDTDLIFKLENYLKHFPLLIRAASARETRERLDAIASELSQISEDQDGLETLRGERNRMLAPLIEKVEEARLAVAKVETSLYQTDVRKQNLLDERRDLLRNLESLKGNFSDPSAEPKFSAIGI